jgi:hypothetical protein
MRREHAFYSRWCQLFDFHLKRLGWSASAFAVKANRSQQAIHAYLCGRARPPLKQVPIWAMMLGLRGEERERFILAAQESHVPAQVWTRLVELERGGTRAATTDQTLMVRALAAESTVAELVELLCQVEALFYTRTIPVDRIRPVRDFLGTSVRAAIVRYARPPDVATDRGRK